MSDYTLIGQADYVLSKCGGRQLPGGLVAVDFPGGLLYNSSNTADQTTTGTRDNPKDTTFYVRSIKIIQDANTYGRIQWPDSKWLSNQSCSLGGSAWFGCLSRAITKEVPIRPGELITILTNPVPTQGAGVGTYTSILFEGVFRYLLKNGRLSPYVPNDAEKYTRYSRTPNGNILAPERELDSEFLEIPKGMRRTPFILQSLSSEAVTIAAPGGEATIEVPISSSFDFFARRFYVEYAFDEGVAGDLLVKRRDGSGYSLDSDFVPIGQMLDAPLAKAWCLLHGVSVFLDFALRNGTGSGNVTISTVNIVGSRQKGAV